MQNVDLFVFVLAGSCLRASAFICGMKGSSPRLGSWMCLHTAGTGLEEESRVCVQVPELSTAFCHHSPSRHTSGRQAQALRGYRCLVSLGIAHPMLRFPVRAVQSGTILGASSARKLPPL